MVGWLNMFLITAVYPLEPARGQCRVAAELPARDRDDRPDENREHDDHSGGQRDNADYLKGDVNDPGHSRADPGRDERGAHNDRDSDDANFLAAGLVTAGPPTHDGPAWHW